MNIAGKLIIFGGFLLLLYFPLFLHLDSENLYQWDESRNAIAALEMIENGNPIVRFYGGYPDSWDTKPPLLIWLQIVSFKIVGFNELGVRLPSALAGLFTILLLFRFFCKELDDFAGGIFTGLCLVTTTGYVGLHITRTGDHDALMIFFLIIGLISTYKLIKYPEKENRYLTILTVSLICGVLTKSIGGLFYCPGILVYVIYKKKLFYFLKQPKVYLAVFTFLFFVIGYYLLRNQMQENYLQKVWEMELLPRYLNNSELGKFHEKDFWYYSKLLWNQFFWPQIYLLPFLVFLIFWKRESSYFDASILFGGTAILFWYAISKGTTNTWYIAPIYPLLATLFGIGLSIIYRSIRKRIAGNQNAKEGIILMVFVLLLFSWPYMRILDSVYFPSKNDSHYGEFIYQIERDFPELKSYLTLCEWNFASYFFYEKVYNTYKGYSLEHCATNKWIEECKNKPVIGGHVMACREYLVKGVKANYEYNALASYKGCELFQITGVKTPSD